MPQHFQHLFLGSPSWLLAAASVGLVLHMTGGGLGIVAGAGALAAPKGKPVHRALGTLFCIVMLVNALMASALAVTLVSRGVSAQMSNVFGGVFTVYFVATAWATVRRPAGTIGRFEVGALAFIALVAVVTLLGLVRVARGGHTDNGVPVAAPISVTFVAVLAGGLDLKVILKGGVSGAARIARHLWRMCLGMFIATGSFFIGQQQVMPKAIQGSPILIVLGFAPLLLMLFWLGVVAFTRTFRPVDEALA